MDDIENISERLMEDAEMFNLYRNSDYWLTDLETAKSKFKSKRKKDFNEMLIKHNLLGMKNDLRIALTNKFNWLLNN